MRKKEPLWYNNKLCPQCLSIIENPENIRACETGFSYCSEDCAIKHIKENAPEGGY